MAASDVCDVCGSTNLKEIKCKLICQNCGTILRSCSDLAQIAEAGAPTS
jgi:rubredoxin